MEGKKPSKAARFYRLLLRLFPFDFRGDFGPEMEEVFHEQHSEAARREGTAGILRLWWETVKGIFTTAPREHLLINLQRVDPGYRPENVLTVQLSLDFSRYTTNEKTLSFFDSLFEKVESVPGVTSAAAAGVFPLDKSPAFNNQFLIEGQQGKAAERPIAELNVVSSGYLQVLGIPLRSGRKFRTPRPSR